MTTDGAKNRFPCSPQPVLFQQTVSFYADPLQLGVSGREAVITPRCRVFMHPAVPMGQCTQLRSADPFVHLFQERCLP